MRYVLFIILLFTVVIQAQDVPSGYTPKLGLRLYDLDDYPGADSLNANAQAIDNFADASDDTMNAVKADVYTLMNYSGALKAGKVTNASLSTEVDTGRVKTTGDDAIYGVKSFYGNTFRTKTHLPLTSNTWSSGTFGFRWRQVNSEYGYFDYLMLVNPTDTTDTTGWGYDGDKIYPLDDKPVSIPNLTITETVIMDSAASLEVLKLFPTGVTFSNVTDSVITLDSVMSNINLTSPGNMTVGIETMNLDGAAVGDVVILSTIEQTDSIRFREDTNDGNLNLDVAGDFYMKNGDYIAFIYAIKSIGPVVYQWNELWRKNN